MSAPKIPVVRKDFAWGEKRVVCMKYATSAPMIKLPIRLTPRVPKGRKWGSL